MAKHFLLVHGLWGTGAVWNGVVDELERRGHTAEAPTLPGHGPGENRSEVTFEDYIQTIDGGHIALMTHPEAVADGLERAVGTAA